MSIMSQYIRTSGAVLTTNAVINVNVGFKPAWVNLLNRNRVVEGYWWASMPDDAMVKRSGAANPAYITSSGISQLDDGTNLGFKIGPDAQMNPTGSDELFWHVGQGHDPK